MNNVIKYKGESITLKQAVNFARIIRTTSSPGAALRGESRHLLATLLERHYKYKDAPGECISISVEIGPTANSRVFCAHFPGGIQSYFGLRSLLVSENQRKRSHLFCAARNEVMGQVKGFMASSFDGGNYATCAITGQPVHRSNASCDHYPIGFNALFVQWLESVGLDRESIEVNVAGKMRRFADKDLASSWREYHRQHAQLRVAELKENHKQGNPTCKQ